MHLFIFVYSDLFGNRDSVVQIVKSIPEIKHWRYDLPNTMYLVSELEAKQLGDIFRSKQPSKRFLLVDITNQPRTGWLPLDTWEFFKKWV